MSDFALRDYQVECLTAIQTQWVTVDRTLAVLATGGGKTVIFLALIDRLLKANPAARVIILAHQRKLIAQPIDRARQMFPDVARQMGVVMGAENNTAARVIVATVQTLSRPGRIEALLAHGAVTHIIYDEAHHAAAETNFGLLAQFPAAKMCGFTATPLRTDGDGLVKVFETVAYRFPIGIAIARGALVPFDALGVALPVTFSGISETAEGWAREPMGDLLKAENVKEIVFKHWTEYSSNRQTIGFTASVSQAVAMAEFFKARGIKAAHVAGITPHDEQARLYKAFESGEIQVIFNCMILTEGADFPQASAVMMIAPTKSDLIYVQRLGRGLRIFPGKVDCRVLDFAPADGRNVIMAGDVLGKPRAVKQAEEQAERQGVLVAISVDRLGHAATIDPSRLIVKVLNLLKQDALAWAVDGRYAIAGLGEKSAVCITLPDSERLAKGEALKLTGQWSTAHQNKLDYLSRFRVYLVNGRAEPKGAFATFEEAKEMGDALALELGITPVLANKKSTWRRDAPSDKQLSFARQMGINIPADCRKGQLAQLLTQALTIREVQKVER